MLPTVWLLTTSMQAQAGCGDRQVAIDALEGSVLAERYEEATARSRAAIASFGCGPLADPSDIARIWLAEAMLLLHYEGDPASSDDAFLAAARLTPNTWLEGYGAELRAHQLELLIDRGDGRDESGTLDLTPLPPGSFGGVDGVRVDVFPMSLPAGLHLVQVGSDPEDLDMARVVELFPDTELVVQTGLAEVAPVTPLVLPDPPAIATRTRRPRRGRVALALALGGVGALTYGSTFLTNQAYARDPSTGLAQFNNGLVVASAGLGITSAGVLVWGLASPGATP